MEPVILFRVMEFFKTHNLLGRNFSETLELSRLVLSLVHTHHANNRSDRRKKNGGQDSNRENETTALRY